jgi:hypothetical protein
VFSLLPLCGVMNEGRWGGKGEFKDLKDNS